MDANTAFARVDAAYETLRGGALEQALLQVAEDAAAENGPRSRVYAAVCSELGGYYRGQARYAESESAFLRALDILRENPGEDSPDCTTLMNNLAGTYRVMKKYDEAEQLFLRCLNSYEKTLGRGHVLYAATLNNLALLCLDRGDLVRASELLTQASEVLAALPDCTDEYAASLCNRSALLLRLHRPAEAVPLLTEAISLFETTLGTDTPHYHAAYHSRGLAHGMLGDHAAAAEDFDIALRAAEALYGPAHPETETIRRSLADARQKQEAQP